MGILLWRLYQYLTPDNQQPLLRIDDDWLTGSKAEGFQPESFNGQLWSGVDLRAVEAIPPIYDLSNITHAAISDGELIIRDQDKQTQDINELSHDTENAHSKLKPIFNKEDEQTRLNIVTSLKELGEQVKELERTIHKDAGKDSQDGKMGNDLTQPYQLLPALSPAA